MFSPLYFSLRCALQPTEGLVFQAPHSSSPHDAVETGDEVLLASSVVLGSIIVPSRLVLPISHVLPESALVLGPWLCVLLGD